MFRHPLTGFGSLMIAYAIIAFFYYLNDEPTERNVQYVGVYIAIGLGAFSILLGVIVQGFRRLERLIAFRNMDAVEADGDLAKILDSEALRELHLKDGKR